MPGKTQPPGSGLSQADHPEPPEAVPGKAARAWSVWTDSEEGPPPPQAHAAPGGLAEQKVPLLGRKGAPFSGEKQPGQDTRLGEWKPPALGVSV